MQGKVLCRAITLQGRAYLERSLCRAVTMQGHNYFFRVTVQARSLLRRLVITGAKWEDKLKHFGQKKEVEIINGRATTAAFLSGRNLCRRRNYVGAKQKRTI